MARGIHQAGVLHDRALGGRPSATADAVTLSSGKVTARVKAAGAEPCSLRDAEGREYLWQAEPAWPRHAPLLFPIVGKLHQDRLIAGGQSYPMGQHGFARDSMFELLEHSATSCRFLLTDGPSTWAAYPFPFRLEVVHCVLGTSLVTNWTVTNPGETLLPFSIGAHPALQWPLPGSNSKLAHALEFEQDETCPMYRLDAQGLLDPTPHPLPLNGRSLGLREELFSVSAMILLNPASRHVRLSAPGAPSVEVAWQGFDQLGLWTKPRAGFLCIEPWAGYADIAGYEVEVWYKPGIQLLHPGESRRFLHRITIGA